MRTRLLALLGILSFAAGVAAIAPTSAGASTETTVVDHTTNVQFATAGGSTLSPNGPLVPGDRAIFRDDLLQGTTVIGFDTVICTVVFNDNAMCEVVADFTNRGSVDATFFWTGLAGTHPAPVYDGVITGGTFAFRGARGSFHAATLPNGDVQITTTLV